MGEAPFSLEKSKTFVKNRINIFLALCLFRLTLTHLWVIVFLSPKFVKITSSHNILEV